MTGAPARAALLAAAAAAALAALPGRAEEPRSVIPWLSRSIEVTTAAPPPSRALDRGGTGRPGEEITVTPLDDVRRDAVGLLPSESTGFARALWGPDDAETVAALVAAQPDGGAPEARALFQRVLLAEADPPRGGDGSTVLLARVDRLLEAGALAQAAALIERAGADTPALFRRWFDADLLLGQVHAPCGALRQNPALSPTLPARVFCLARGGDWNAAEITLTLGQQVGSIPEGEEAILARFLDPELFEGEDPPPVPEPFTALDFLMREAVGLPRPPGPLPLAFLHLDLEPHVPMRSRITAAEQLTLSGAVPYPVLMDAYRSGAPAASGGVWDRAAAVQALDEALEGNAGVGPALLAADAALSARGLRVALARAFGPSLASLDPATLPEAARPALFELLLLAGAVDAASRAAGPDPAPREAALLALAGAKTVAPPPAPEDERLAAALDGLAAESPADDREGALAALVAAGRQGQALLGALALVAAGSDTDAPALRAAVLTLRLAGQEESARTLALQTVLGAAG